jgi:hypothetical protein
MKAWDYTKIQQRCVGARPNGGGETYDNGYEDGDNGPDNEPAMIPERSMKEL